MSLCVPLLLGIFVSEARGIYLQRLADNPHIDVEAGRAALKWSRTIGDSLVQVFPYALSIGIFPYLADLARERDRQPLTDTLLGAIRVCFFAFAPLTAIIIALRFPLLRAVWEGGHMTEADTRAMSGPFVGFTVGLIAFSCEMLLNQTFYAMTDAWVPTLMGLLTTVLWIVIAKFGVESGYGLTAIALAESISKGAKCLGMWILLRPKLGDVKVRGNLIFLLKVTAGSLLAALVAGVGGHVIVHHAHGHGKLRALIAVSAAGSAGLALYLVLGAVAGIEEVQAVMAFVRRLRGRLASP
jgi:peptidoglycan biosynthesis protein MviN/MurJ (putative lipid II flippase)